MNNSEAFGYMSVIETASDVNNSFLSRREIVCNFAGVGGKLDKLQAIEMVSKKFKLDGKLVIPMGLENHVGKSTVTGTFFVYEDEKLSKAHINPTVFKRLAKSQKARDEAAAKPEADEKPEAQADAKDAAKSGDVKEAPADEKPKEAEAKPEEADKKPEAQADAKDAAKSGDVKEAPADEKSEAGAKSE